MTIDEERLAEIERLAAAAREFQIPGDWYTAESFVRDCVRPEDAELLAACDPTTVAGLVAEVRRLRVSLAGTENARKENAKTGDRLIDERDRLRAEVADLRDRLDKSAQEVVRMGAVIEAARVVAAEERSNPYVPRTSMFVLMTRVEEYDVALADGKERG